jgi:putative lipoprotein
MLPRQFKVLLIACSTLLLGACASTPYQQQELQGSVSYLQKIALPPETTMLHLRLLDVSGSGGAATLLGEQFINHPAHFPVPFALQYDQSAIIAGAHYELTTQVYSEGELRMQGSTPLALHGTQLPGKTDVVLKGIE